MKRKIKELRLPWKVDMDPWIIINIVDCNDNKVGTAESLIIADFIIEAVNKYYDS